MTDFVLGRSTRPELRWENTALEDLETSRTRGWFAGAGQAVNSLTVLGVRQLRLGAAGAYDDHIIDPEEANALYGIENRLSFDQPVAMQEAMLRNRFAMNDMRRESIYQRSRLGGVGRFTANLMGNMADPANIATAFIPFAGSAKLATMARAVRMGTVNRTQALAVRASLGAGNATIGNALLEPGIYAMANNQALDYTAMDIMASLGFGALVGGAARGGIDAIGDVIARRSYETRREAFRAGMADMLENRHVDVEDILRSDPSYRYEVSEFARTHREQMRRSTALTTGTVRPDAITARTGDMPTVQNLDDVVGNDVAYVPAGNLRRSYRTEAAAERAARRISEQEGIEAVVTSDANGKFRVKEVRQVDIHSDNGQPFLFRDGDKSKATSYRRKQLEEQGYTKLPITEDSHYMVRGLTPDDVKRIDDGDVSLGIRIPDEHIGARQLPDRELTQDDIDAFYRRKTAPESHVAYTRIDPDVEARERAAMVDYGDTAKLQEEIDGLIDKYGDKIRETDDIVSDVEDYIKGMEAALRCVMR